MMSGPERQSLDARWRMLVVLFAARTTLGLQFQTIASTAPFLRETFGIGFAEVGTLIGSYMLPGVLLSLPGGVLVRRFGDKTLCCTGLGLMVLGGALIGISNGYGLALAGRLISGTGSVFLSLAVTKMTTDWFAGREIVTAMGILVTSWPFGIAVGLVVFVPLAETFGWPFVMTLTAGACLLALLIVAALYRSPGGASEGLHSSTAVQPAQPAFKLLSRQEALPVTVAGLIWGVFNLGLVSFFSFVPSYLAQHGYSLREGAFLTSVVLWVLIASIPLGGRWLQRFAQPDLGIILCSALTGLTLAALPLFPLAAPPISLALGLLIGPPPGAIMAMPGRVLRPESRAVGLGLFMTAYNITNAAGPALAGALRDSFGASAPILFGAVVFLSVAPLTLLFRGLSPPQHN
jgi:predicted MFS family arabinose efflux permease